MVYHKVSIDMKQCAVELLQRRWEVDAIAEPLSVSNKSIGRWAKNLELQGSVEPPKPFQGRPRVLQAEIVAELVELIHQNPTLYLDEITEWLAVVHDQPISRSCMNDTLLTMNLASKQLQRTAAERDKVARSNWRKMM